MNRTFLIVAIVLVGIAATFFLLKSSGANSQDASVPTISADVQTPMNYTYQVVNTFPHDPDAFTQGLIYDKGIMYEGTGLFGQSTLRKVDFKTGTVLKFHKLAAEYFGEGLTLWNGKLIQLTWTNQVGFVYDQTSFDLIQTFNYPTEGWGITHDDKKLIMSDGTANLYFLDPDSLSEIGRVRVTEKGAPVERLNELEYIKGFVYANIWQTDRIAIINPSTGQIVGWVDLSGLMKPEFRTNGMDVLNGIAYDAEHDRLFITGKKWSKLFEIKLVPKP
jgi:glutamine cyclotransferase